jgi:hypothetical protein
MDRVLAVIVALVLMGLITVIIIEPGAVRSLLAGISEVNLLLRLAVVVVLNAVILIALYLTLRQPHKPISGLAVRAPGAYTDVNIESAKKLILKAVENVPDVLSASANVTAVAGKADVDLHVQVAGTDIHIPQKQKEINRALRQVIHKQLGLELRGRPRVHIALKGDDLPALTVSAPEAATKPPQPPAPETASAQKQTGTPAESTEKTTSPASATSADNEQPKTDDWLKGFLAEQEKNKPEQSQ